MSNAAPVRALDPMEGSGSLIDPSLLTISGEGRVRLVCGRCTQCGAESFPKAEVCTSCLSLDVDSFELDGPGALFAFSVIHQGPRHWHLPYAVGYVDFPGGLRVFGHIKGPFESLAIGSTMKIELGELGTNEQGGPLTSYIFAVEE